MSKREGSLDITELMALSEIEPAVRELEATGLAARDRGNPRHLFLLTDELAGATLPDDARTEFRRSEVRILSPRF
jgi:hypothetical protein